MECVGLRAEWVSNGPMMKEYIVSRNARNHLTGVRLSAHLSSNGFHLSALSPPLQSIPTLI